MKHIIHSIALFLLLTMAAQGSSLRLHRLLQDHVVLQRDKPLNIEGEAIPGAAVQVAFATQGSTHGETTVAGSDGRWRALLPALPAGGAYTLEVKSGAESIAVSDILIGDVWIASGQSNMGHKMRDGVSGGAAELAAAQYPNIRYFEVPHRPSDEPRADIVEGAWEICSPETVGSFSAVGFYFARKVHMESGIPIGIIDSSWGGSSIEAWMPADTLAGIPHAPGPVIQPVIRKEFTLEHYAEINDQNIERMLKLIDTSFEGLVAGVQKPEYDDSKWATISIPEWGETSREIFWLRKSFDWRGDANGPVQLSLGFPNSHLNIYLNGIEVYKASEGPCRTQIDRALLKPGRNVIVLRLANPWWWPYIDAAAGDLKISDASGNYHESLAGKWAFSKSIEPPLPSYSAMQEVNSALYNGMIAPVTHFGIAGVIWYQGENNGDRGFEYRRLFPAMIQDWRIRFAQGYTPFYFVQLANWGTPTELAESAGWAFLREAQDQALHVPFSGMAVTIDVGEARNIHPKNKMAVGERLARHALKAVYGKEGVHTDGPRFKTFRVVSGEVRIQFSHTGELKTSDDTAPKSFCLAGKDRIFHVAKAALVGDEVALRCPEVPEPVAVRFGWAKNPIINLHDNDGLPAAPFRTDDWPSLAQ